MIPKTVNPPIYALNYQKGEENNELYEKFDKSRINLQKTYGSGNWLWDEWNHWFTSRVNLRNHIYVVHRNDPKTCEPCQLVF